MTRFDAADPEERRKLFADAVVAHRERGSAFLTVELDPSAVGAADENDGAPGGGTSGPADDENDGAPGDGDGDAAGPPPWIQFADRTFNLDCTDAELARLEDLLESFPEFRIDALESPEGAAGTNVRITARSDPNRLAAFLDRAFAAVYGAPDGYRAWVVRI
ncbi:MAG: hypothetical protein ABEH40_06290 [Haloferacaceae archaeon]